MHFHDFRRMSMVVDAVESVFLGLSTPFDRLIKRFMVCEVLIVCLLSLQLVEWFNLSCDIFISIHGVIDHEQEQYELDGRRVFSASDMRYSKYLFMICCSDDGAHRLYHFMYRTFQYEIVRDRRETTVSKTDE